MTEAKILIFVSILVQWLSFEELSGALGYVALTQCCQKENFLKTLKRMSIPNKDKEK